MKDKIIGIDFESVVSKKWRTRSMYGDNSEIPRKGIKEFLQALKDEGNTIVIHSSEFTQYVKSRKQWLDFHEIPYDELICGRLKFDIYVGNEAVSFDGDWKETLNELIKNDCYTNK